MTTANKALNQPAYNSTNWDVPLNTNFGFIDTAFGSTANVSNTSNYTLSSTEYQCMRLRFNGTLSANVTISIPSGVGGMWVVTNATTDASAAVPCYLTVNTTAGGSVGVNPPRGATVTIFSDGTNISYAFPFPLPGTLLQYAGTSAPSGYLACDGAAVSRSTYSALWAAIGSTWGSGNGTTTFNVPDLRGVFLRGTGTNSNGAAGQSVGSYAADTYLNHSHTATSTDSGHNHLILNYGPNAAGGGSGWILQGNVNNGKYTETSYANVTTTVATSTTGGTETKPKNFGVLMCIKY